MTLTETGPGNGIHLGDGAYVHWEEGGALVLTANHHDPRLASDTVALDEHAVKALTELLERVKKERLSTGET